MEDQLCLSRLVCCTNSSERERAENLSMRPLVFYFLIQTDAASAIPAKGYFVKVVKSGHELDRATRLRDQHSAPTEST